MITVQGITKRFGDITAVNNISFTIKEGEITGLLGPNGAGKTTTLRMLTGYLKPDSGTITIGDFSVNDDSVDVRRIVGYFGLVPVIHMLVAIISSLNAGDRDERSGIAPVRHQHAAPGIGELSGVQKRVIAQSMIHDPEILILDEPTSGLDPNQIIEIRNLIREIGKKKTIILSTHILPEVEATCDRVIIIDRGSIAADDRTEILQAASGGENLVTVRITGADFGQLKGELMKLPGVTRVDELPDSDLVAAQVTAGGTADIRPEIFRMVSGRNWTLYEMMLEQRSLERVFRDLTAGGGK